MATIVNKLVQSSLQPTSLPTYKRSWKLFYTFFHTTFPGATITLPISASNLALFIAFLFDRGYASSTVSTYISALSYSHKLFRLTDPTKVFFIIQMLKGYSKLDKRVDARLPITTPILHKILSLTSELSLSRYELCLFRAMCSLAFHAFLRVGEMAVTNNNSNNVLCLNNVAKQLNADNEVISIRVTFAEYKHNYNTSPFSMIIKRTQCFCPVDYLLNYLRLRGTGPGNLFLLRGEPVTRKYFCELLAKAIKLCGLNPSRYKGHSFRIGAASEAAERGMSDAQIRSCGRWKSNAFLRYIRLQATESL